VATPESDSERTRNEIARARRALIIVFGLGGLVTAGTIVWVMRHLPEGHLAITKEAAPYALAKGCKKFGESCEIDRGKLGSCMTRENCFGPNCLFCQSQH
jgi:hypothetical protein